MAEKVIAYGEWLTTRLADPHRAARYLNTAAEESEAMFLKALRKVALAQTRPIAKVAESCGVSRESLYRMLSESGNPTSENRRAILAALGFKSVVVPIDAHEEEKPSFDGIGLIVGGASVAQTRDRGLAEGFASQPFRLSGIVSRMFLCTGAFTAPLATSGAGGTIGTAVRLNGTSMRAGNHAFQGAKMSGRDIYAAPLNH
jgi:probable addiction module antidote protein